MRLAPGLYRLIVDAEKAARAAHDHSYVVRAPFWVRVSLGRAQSILMHYVVKGAAARAVSTTEETRADAS